MADWSHWASLPLLPSAHPSGKGGDAPEGNIVQAHARQHDQEAVPQHLLVVSIPLLPRLWSLRPHTMKLGPVSCIWGFPGAAGKKKKTVWGRGSPGDLEEKKRIAKYRTCVPDEQSWEGRWPLEALGELLSGAGGRSFGGSAPG